MADNFQDEGTMEVWLRHDHEDWVTNSDGYDFGTFTKEGVTVSTAKHPDKTIEFDVDGPLAQHFNIRVVIPPCDERGLYFAMTWGQLEFTLYLNGQPAKYWKGRIVRIVAWPYALKDSEISALFKGVQPTHGNAKRFSDGAPIRQ